jgi:hypothetical protein
MGGRLGIGASVVAPLTPPLEAVEYSKAAGVF